MVNDFLNLVVGFDELTVICVSILRYIVFIEDLGFVFSHKICFDCLLTLIEIYMNETIGYLWVEYQQIWKNLLVPDRLTC